MRPSLILICFFIATLSSCKKEEPSSNYGGDAYPEPCEKILHILGNVKDSITNTPISGLNISCESMGEFVRVTDSLGNYSNIYQWQPCGKFPVEFGEYGPTLFVSSNQSFCSPNYNVDISGLNEGDTTYFDLFVNTPTILEVNYTDNSIDGTLLSLPYYGGTPNSMNLTGGTDTTFHNKACPNCSQRLYVYTALTNIKVIDTLINITANDTTVITLSYP